MRFERYKFEVDESGKDDSNEDELAISVTSDLFAVCSKNDILVELRQWNYSLFIVN